MGGVEEEEAWWALGAAGAAVPREEAGHLLPVWAWILLTSLSLLILLALGKDRHSTFDITTIHSAAELWVKTEFKRLYSLPPRPETPVVNAAKINTFFMWKDLKLLLLHYYPD